jgi:hypothetical protein
MSPVFNTTKLHGVYCHHLGNFKPNETFFLRRVIFQYEFYLSYVFTRLIKIILNNSIEIFTLVVITISQILTIVSIKPPTLQYVKLLIEIHQHS